MFGQEYLLIINGTQLRIEVSQHAFVHLAEGEDAFGKRFSHEVEGVYYHNTGGVTKSSTWGEYENVQDGLYLLSVPKEHGEDMKYGAKYIVIKVKDSVPEVVR